MGVVTGRPKKLFIFVNPFGGRKSAFKVFTDDVKPILEDANIEYTLQGLTHIQHLVVNGLLEREDWQAALKMAIGVIPAALIRVNASGQFCGVAEMVGPVDFVNDAEYWHQDRWSGQFVSSGT
ncbi:hypothetical protein L6452_14054 [Arctium lappa]|uniref:Uncharacterized protein n=1 Tax=Arctium lappa TaxID=4217 RepID=A0ACB9CK98_ARCLA|nr:hypothetical protein L6452_14054 [Arctium lappa]